jgi:hypothetical protein
MAVRNLSRQQLPDEEMATYGLWSEWDDFYLAVLAAIAASRPAGRRNNAAALWRPVDRSARKPTRGARPLMPEQPTFRQCLLSSARPQRCICADFQPLAQTRRFVKAEQALTDIVNAGRGLWQCAPFASRDNNL